MTLTDEEARKVLAIIRSHGRCWACEASGKMIPWASLTQMGEPVNCPYCDGKGNRHKEIITLLESRIGAEDELTAAYMSGFERGKDALSARVRKLEEALRPFAELAEELSPERCEPEDECGLFKVVGDETLDRRLRVSEIFRAARALKGECETCGSPTCEGTHVLENPVRLILDEEHPLKGEW